ALIVGDALAVENRHDHRAGLRLAVELAERGERRLQARDADGKSGCRHRLTHEARHESIVTPAAADRAETHGPAFVVFRFDQEFNFVDRSGVVLETADDGGVDTNPFRSISGSTNVLSDFLKFLQAFATGFGVLKNGAPLIENQ